MSHSNQEHFRLAIVLPSHWSALRGGAELQVRYLLDRITDPPWSQVRYFAGNVDADFSADGYTVVNLGRGRRGRGARVVQSLRLHRALARFRPHVIYQRVGCAYTGVAAHYARAAGARMVWHIAHESDVTPDLSLRRRPVRWLEKRMLEYGVRRADGIVAQTRIQADLLQRHYGRSDATLIRNFHPLPETAGKRGGTPVVLWIANHKPWKRPELFIELARGLAGVPCEFRMVGRLPDAAAERDRLLGLVSSAGNVKHLGPLSQEAVNEELSRSDVLVNTSVAEGFSNTFIQAWMRSVPVYTLGVDPDGVISENAIGHVAGSLEELAAALSAGLARREGLHAAGERARAFATSQFSVANADRLLGILGDHAREVVGGVRSPAEVSH